MQARTVAPDGDHTLVARRKGIGQGVGEAHPEGVTALLSPVDLEDGKAAVLDSLLCVLVEGLGDPPRFRVVLPHEPLVLPLALGAVAEDENSGTAIRDSDGG